MSNIVVSKHPIQNILFKTSYSKHPIQNILFKTFYSKHSIQNILFKHSIQNILFKTFYSKHSIQNILFKHSIQIFIQSILFKYSIQNILFKTFYSNIYSKHSIMNFTHGGLVNSVGYYLQNVIEKCHKIWEFLSICDKIILILSANDELNV